MRAMRRQMQIIFQDPYSSLNPRMTAGNIIGEPLAVHGLVNNRREYRERVAELLNNVGLNPYMADRFPPRVQRWTAPAHRRGPRPVRGPGLHRVRRARFGP